MNKKPLVSIIIPCYNQGNFLPETLDSVLLQTYSNWECIIINDGSTDITESVALRYCKKDDRFKYFYQENKGLSASRNKGINNSLGKYILPLDSDDLIGKEYVEKSVEILENNPNIEIVYCKAKLFGIKKGIWQLPEYSLNRLLGENCIFCSAFFRRETYVLVGGYKENMKYGLEDWDFWLSIVEIKGENIVHKINEILFFYRIRKNSMARSLDTNRLQLMREQIWNNHRKLYSEHYYSPINSFEFQKIVNSKEYRVGTIIIKPLRFILNVIDNIKNLHIC